MIPKNPPPRFPAYPVCPLPSDKRAEYEALGVLAGYAAVNTWTCNLCMCGCDFAFPLWAAHALVRGPGFAGYALARDLLQDCADELRRTHVCPGRN